MFISFSRSGAARSESVEGPSAAPAGYTRGANLSARCVTTQCEPVHTVQCPPPVSWLRSSHCDVCGPRHVVTSGLSAGTSVRCNNDATGRTFDSLIYCSAGSGSVHSSVLTACGIYPKLSVTCRLQKWKDIGNDNTVRSIVVTSGS